MAMTPKDCLGKVTGAAKKDKLSFNEEDLQSLAADFKQKLDPNKSAVENAKQYRELMEKRSENKQKYRLDLMRNEEKAAKLRDAINTKVGRGNFFDRVRAAIQGRSMGATAGLEGSIRERANFTKQKLSAIWDTASKAYKSIVDKSQYDHEIYPAMLALAKGDPIPEGTSKIASTIAQAAHAVNMAAYEIKKAVNPNIESREDFIVKQFHNREKIQAVTSDKWVSKVMEHAGEKSFPGKTTEEKMKLFRDIYDKITDGSYSSSQNLDRKMTLSRQIIMNSPESAFKYNQEFGHGNIAETMSRMIDSTAKDTAVMDRFGSKPKEFIEKFLDQAINDAKTDKERQMLISGRKNLMTMFDAATGVNEAPARDMATRAFVGASNLLAIAKTSGAFFHSISDMAHGALEIRASDGSNVFMNTLKIVHMAASSFVNSAERKLFLQKLGVFVSTAHENMARDMGVGLGDTGYQKFESKLSGLQGKLSMMDRFHQSTKLASAVVLASHLYDNAGKAFDQLGKFAGGLHSNGIDHNMWEVIRLGSQDLTGRGDRMVLSPDGVNKLPDSVFEKYIKARDGSSAKPSAAAISQAKWEVESRLGTFINTTASAGSGVGTDRTSAFLLRGTSVNTFEGKMWRTITQFQTAAWANADVVRRAISRGEGGRWDMQGGAQFAVSAVALAAMSYHIDQLIQGKTPGNIDEKAALKILAMSGAAGALGHQLTDAISNSGHQNVAEAFGKTIMGSIGGTAYTAGQALFGSDRNKGFARSSLLTGNIPIISTLPYTKAVFNYVYANEMREMNQHGYLNRLESNMRKNGQEQFIFKGSAWR